MKKFGVAMALSTLLAARVHAQEGHQHPGNAKAVLMPGFGSVHHRIYTPKAEAQRFFDQGLNLMYGFNHEEAVRSFQRAAAIDPHCVMCRWGAALALGPNINDPELDAAREKAAFEAARKAASVAAESGNRAHSQEQDYVRSLTKRYSADAKADLKKCAAEYSQAMRDLMRKYPDDLDAATLFAESAMDLRPWQLWGPDGKAAPGTEEILGTLESVLKRNPTHLGANHYYIHATEASGNPQRALASAERLKTLAPASGHLVHMPAHVYMRVGDYHGASHANEVAAAADRAYISAHNVEGMYPLMYYSHNLHFLAVSSSMEGRFHDAQAAASQVQARAAPAAKDMPMLEWFVPTPTLVLVRFAKWDEVLRLPKPDPALRLHTAIWRFARGLAFNGHGEFDKAAEELTALRAVIGQIPKDTMFGFSPAQSVLKVGERMLSGKLAAGRGKTSEALKALREAIDAEDQLSYDEPPDWYVPAREALGAVLLRSGDAAKAEGVFRDELTKHPNNGRALWGLQRSLERQGKSQDASSVNAKFQIAWKYADTQLRLEDF